MPRSFISNFAFNRGILSPLGLARYDLKRYALSAQKMVNWMARTLGSMMLRPGTVYVDTITSGANPAYHIPFIYSVADTAIVEMTSVLMRVRVNEVYISRVAVASAITNGTFVGNINGWTSSDQVGCTSAYAAVNNMGFTGNGFNSAVRYQQVTVAGGDQNKEHGIHLTITKGLIDLRVGTTAGDGSYILLRNLGPGEYSLAFTPTGNFYVWMQSSTRYQSLISQCIIEAAAPMQIATPYASADLSKIRWDQSASVVFLACKGYAQYSVNRYSTRSWALVQYLPKDGPFGLINTNLAIQLTPSALNGDILIGSNSAYFTSGMVNSLIKIASVGQSVSSVLTGNSEWTNPIEITGVGAAQRNFNLTLSGSWSGTATLQQSVGAPGAWIAYSTYTSNQSGTVISDALDNQIIFYRLGFDISGYTSGSVTASMSYNNGSINGIARIDAYLSPTSVDAFVLQDFGGTQPSATWTPGIWSTANGYPTVPNFYEGRLWWHGNDYIIGSVSDAYASFDSTVIGDSGHIIRTLAQGPVSTIQWALGLQRMLIGCDGVEQSIQSDALNSPLTPTNFSAKSPSTRGSAGVAAVKIDTNGIFVQRGDPTTGNISGTRLIQMSYQGLYAIVDYSSNDLTEFCPEVTQVGINRICVQRKIDTRIHCVLNDGTVAILLYDPVENEKCWMTVNLPGGFVEDAFVMPGAVAGGVEDSVYYSVKRTINGITERYLERWALESECTGLMMAKCLDSHIAYSGAATTSISGLTSFGTDGAQQVSVWGWNTVNPYVVTLGDGSQLSVGQDMGLYTPSVSGVISGLPSAVTNAIVGLPYTAQWQSVKLIQTLQGEDSMMDVKSIDRLGVMIANTHCQGLQYGRNFTDLDNMPQVVDGGYALDLSTVFPAEEYQDFTFEGAWETNARLCLQAASPRPATLLAAKVGITVK